MEGVRSIVCSGSVIIGREASERERTLFLSLWGKESEKDAIMKSPTTETRTKPSGFHNKHRVSMMKALLSYTPNNWWK
jgi:hypothetical protein